MLGIALLHNFTNTVHSVQIDPVNNDVTGNGTLVATAKDRLGGSMQNIPFTWKSTNDEVLKFPHPSSGDFQVTTGKNKTVEVTATARNGVADTITVRVP